MRARAAHVKALVAVLRANMGHLSPWMPWATPSNATPEVQSARLVQVELHWVNGTDFDYLIVTGGGSQVAPDTIAGRLSLMTRQGAGVLEIGYWLSADQTGRGFVTNAARATRLRAWRYRGSSGPRSIATPAMFRARPFRSGSATPSTELSIVNRLHRATPDARWCGPCRKRTGQ